MDPVLLSVLNRGGSIGIVAFTILLIVLIVQVFKLWQVKITADKEMAKGDLYKNLAEESVSAQKKAVDEQQKITEELAQIRDRLASIEKILREVE